MDIFGKKKKAIELSIIEKALKIIERPRICCIDLSDDVVSSLRESAANISVGSLGSKIEVPNINSSSESTHFIKLNFDFPNNLQEFDIFLLDLGMFHTKIYNYSDHDINKIDNNTSMILVSRFPETEFDPRPLSAAFLNKYLYKINNRPILIIAFSGVAENTEYEILKNSQELQLYQQTNIYSFWNGVPLDSTQFGSKTIVCKSKDNDLRELLEKYKDNITYNQTFRHPVTWTIPYPPSETFTPLMTNINGDIISFIEKDKNKTLIVLPQIDDKTSFLLEFLSTIAPSNYTELFPFSTLHKWREQEQYWLPNHSQLIKKKKDLETSSKNKIENIDSEIYENIKDFSFLHEILTESDDLLKFPLIKYFQWLEFDDVIDYDEIISKRNTIKEEDIQIKLPDNGLLVIECKGIGGTSKDSDCSKVLKYKNRQISKGENKFVYALYIVNHQRHKPPMERENPPFTSEQIQDAKNDGRGLVTTWQLFNVFFDIEKGVYTKKEIRESILDFGLIEFKPSNLIYIDEPKEIKKDGYVCIVNLRYINIVINEVLFSEKNGKFEKVEVLDIQENGKSIQQASNGEFGLMLNSKITINSKIWKKLT